MREGLRLGLDRAGALGVGHGYAEITGGITSVGREFLAYARGEVGYRPTAAVTLFGFAEGQWQTSVVPAYQAGVGACVTW